MRFSSRNPYSLLLVAALVFMIYPVSVVLGRKDPNQATFLKSQIEYFHVNSSQPGSLSFSSSILLLETNAAMDSSQIWRMALPAFESKQEIAVISHPVGYPPIIRQCPGINALAVTAFPPGSSEYSIRIQGGDLWWIDSRSSTPVFLASRVGSPAYPAPDCQSLVFSRLTPLPQPKSEQIPYRTDFVLLDLRSGQSRMILTDDQNYGLSPLGWNSTGSQFIWLTISITGEYSVNALNPVDSKILFTRKITGFDSIRSPQLSPDGTFLLFEGIVKGKSNIYYQILSPSGSLSQDSIPLLSPVTTRDIPPAKAVWSEDGNLTWLGMIPGGSRQVGGLIINHLAQNERVAISAEHPLTGQWIPEALSNKGIYRVWREYPMDYPGLILETVSSGAKREIPRQDPHNLITWIGWMVKQ